MDREQLLNDQEEATRLFLEGDRVGLWTALPGIVKSVDFTQMTCEVQPAIQAVVVDQNGNPSAVNLPLLIHCPIVFPSGGGFTVSFPIAAGDEVLVVFASRCIDAWWYSGGIQQAMEARMHDLSDGFVIPGPRSLPNVPGSVSASNLQIRNQAGTQVISLNADGKLTLKNAAQNLATVLQSLMTNLENLTVQIAALTVVCATPGSPSSPPVNVAAIVSVGTALVTNATQLGALLE